MKKKVLFALIALFSFVSAWAVDVTLTGLLPSANVDGRDVWVIGSASLPGAKVGATAVDAANITYFDAEGNPVTEITKVGWYFARVENGNNVSYLPFQAWKSVAFEYIDSEEKFAASVSGGALELYYEEWTPAEAGAERDAWLAEQGQFKVAADKNNDKTKNGAGFPWVVFKSTEAENCRVSFVFLNSQSTTANPSYSCIFPWSSYHAGTNYGNTSGTPIFFSTADKKYGVASMPEEFYADQETAKLHQLWWDGTLNSGAGGYENRFYTDVEAQNPVVFGPEANQLQVYFTPESLEAPVLAAGYYNYSWTRTPASVAYNGNAQKPAIVVKADQIDGQNVNKGVVVPEFAGENDPNWIVKYFTEAACVNEVTEMKKVGKYYVQVYLPAEEQQVGPAPGQDQGDEEDEPIGDPQTFEITQTKIIISPSYVYKKFGQPDPPKPNFELASGQNMTPEQRDEILPFVFLKRLPGQEGEDKGMYEYFIDVVRNQSGNNYEISVINNYSYLVVDPVPATIAWTDDALWKTYGDYDPNFKEKLSITVPEDIYQFVRVYPEPALAEGEEAPEYTEEEQALRNKELAAMQTIFNNITITREKGPVNGVYNEEGEDVGFYDLTASLGTAAEVANFTLTETTWEDAFEIRPYNITPIAEVKDDEGKVTTPANPKSEYVISVKDTEYNGAEQKQKPTVTFLHKALNKVLDLTDEAVAAVEADPTATPPVEAVEGRLADYTLTWSGVLTNVTRKANTQDEDKKSVVTVDAGTVEDATLNPNFIGQKSANYAITAATLVTSFRKDWTKEYGTDDPGDILNPVFPAVGEVGGFKTEADKTLATTDNGAGFFIAKPVYKRAKGEDVGTYEIYAENVGTAQNYNIVPGETGLLTITLKELTITPNDGEKFFGQADPEMFTYTVTGLLAKDQEAFNNSAFEFFTREEGEEVGDYDIYPISNEVTLGNYHVSFVDNEGELKQWATAVFTIKPAANKLKIIADSKSKTYGQKDPKLTFHAEFLTGIDEETGEPIYTPYELTKALNDVIGARIYRESGEDATRRDATSTEPLDPEKPYYVIDFDDNYEGEEIEDEDKLPTVINGYSVDYEFGRLHINKANLHVKYVDETIKFGATPKKDIELQKDNNGKTDLQNNDSWEEVKKEILKTDLEFSGYPIYDEDGEIVKDGPGTYTMTVEGGEIQNYIVHYGEGTLTVTAGGLTIWALPQTAQYPQPVNKAYTTPAAKFTPIANVTIAYTKDPEYQFPADFDFSDIVELSCTATAVGTNKKAITIKLKEGVTNYDVTLENPYTDEIDNGAADFTVTRLDEIHLAYANVAQALEDHKGQENMRVFLPNRKLTAGLWYTFSLPFEFRVPDLSNKEQIYYCVADILDEEANDGNFHFINTTGHIAANQPFLLKAEALDETDAVAVTADVLETVSFAGVTIAAEDEDGNEFVYNDLAQAPFREDAAGNQFIAQYTGVAKKDFAANEKVFGWNATDGIYQFGTPTKAIAQTVAFIGLASTAAEGDVRIFIQEADGTVTEISAVDAAVDAEFAEGWYTITGIKLDAKPTEKGVYIYNGKKVSIQ